MIIIIIIIITDTIDHYFFLSRFRHTFEIEETALLFFEFYTKERVPIVSVHGYNSDPFPLL